MKTLLAFVTLATAGVLPLSLCQTPGQRGHTANARGQSQGPGYLGVGVVDITPERAKALKLSEPGGVEVKLVDDDSPAAKAGLRTDDVILAVNGQKVEGRITFISMIGVGFPGAKAALTVWREGAKRTLTATLEARPEATMFLRAIPEGQGMQMLAAPFEIMPAPAPVVGIDGETLTPQLAEFFGVTEGVLIQTVRPGTPAEKAGLRAGDVIVKVNGIPVDSIREISGVVRAGRKAFSFSIVRNHKPLTLNLELAVNFKGCHADGPSSPLFA
jgi:serine protease Do